MVNRGMSCVVVARRGPIPSIDVVFSLLLAVAVVLAFVLHVG